MSILDELTKTNEPVNLEELAGVGTPELGPIANRASLVNHASFSAALTDDPANVVPAYQEILTDLETVGSSVRDEVITQTAKDTEMKNSEKVIVDTLVSPDLNDDQKAAVVNDYVNPDSPRYSKRRIVENRSLSKSSEGETVEAEDTRIDIAGSLDKVDSYRREVQSLLNEEAGKTNQVFSEKAIEFASSLVPYVDQAYVAGVAANVTDVTGENPALAVLQSFGTLGEEKEDIIQALQKMPLEARLDATQKLLEAVKASTNVAIFDEQGSAKLQLLNEFLVDGAYTTTDKWIDNVVSVLDMVGVGATAKSLVKGGAKASKAVRGIKSNFVRTHTQPSSLAKVYQSTNPQAARATHEAAATDTTGEVVEALYGTNTVDAVGGDLGPVVLREDGVVEARVNRLDKSFTESLTPDADVLELVTKRDGALRFTDGEKKRVRADVFNKVKEATGLTLRNEGSAVGRTVNDSIRIQAVYGPPEGGFSDALTALEHTAYSMRDLGVTTKDLNLLMRNGDEYTPVEFTGPMPKGDYLVSVNYDYKVNPADISDWDNFSVKRNLFDRMGVGLSDEVGSFQRHVMDPASMLDPRMTVAANSTVDKVAGLEHSMLELGKRFTDKFVKLDKSRKGIVLDYIKNANENSVPFDMADLMANGYRAEEISALQDWKRYWDTQYWLENRDLTRTLKNRGYGVYTSPANGTRIFVKPFKSRATAGSSARAYDPATDTIVDLDSNALTSLYNSNGFIAKARSPVNHNGDVAEFVLSREDMNVGYVRGINDWDQVLNYRPGYYQVQYVNPKFIVERVKDKNGKVLYEKAVGTAGNTYDATIGAKRLAQTSGKVFDNSSSSSDFYIRGDVKKTSIDSDDYWNLQVGVGRTAQRIRGKRLEDASSPVNFGANHSHIMGPVDTMVHSARSIANRVHMRDYLDASKTRFMEQYKDVLPRDQYNQAVFPSSVSQIQKPGRQFDKDLADARTTWEYINSLEVGYINSLNAGYKALLNGTASALGKMSVSRNSKALGAAERYSMYLAEAPGINDMAKNVAFTAYIATNPIRQLIIQPHQATLLTANFPKYVLSQRLANDLSAFLMKKSGIPDSVVGKVSARDSKELKEMMDEFDASGLAASIDKQNLIRGSLTDMVELQRYKRGRRGVLFGSIAGLRKIGFDTGEYINILSAWLAYHDKYRTAKKTLSQTDYDEIAGLARSYTLNMNRAGEMPYNSNTLSMVFQFMQVPHKMALMATNRTLSRAERGRMIAYNTAMFGTVGYGGADLVEGLFGDVLPDDPELRDLTIQGVEGYMFNKGLSLAYGEETEIDWSGLAPMEMYGFMEFLTVFVTSDVGKIVASSPSGQMFFGNNPRITQAFQSGYNWFTGLPDYSSVENVKRAGNVLHDALSISSMYSNAFKAAQLMKYGAKVNALGGRDEELINNVEAMAKVAGFNSMDEAARSHISYHQYLDSQEFDKDVNAWYDEKKRSIEKSLPTEDTYQITTEIVNSAWEVFGDNEVRAREIIMRRLKSDVQNKDTKVMKGIIDAMGWEDLNKVESRIRDYPFNEEHKQQLLERLNEMREWREGKDNG